MSVNFTKDGAGFRVEADWDEMMVLFGALVSEVVLRLHEELPDVRSHPGSHAWKDAIRAITGRAFSAFVSRILNAGRRGLLTTEYLRGLG